MIYKDNGFTLVEILLVMGLIMILSMIGIGTYTIASVKSRDTLRKGELNQIVRAVESFNQDLSRYPLSDADNNILCYHKENGTVTNVECANGKLSSSIDGEITNYMTLPSDPVQGLKYVYISDTGTSFGLYTHLDNPNDKDLLIGLDGNPDLDPWGISCGTAPCNYVVTEEGVTKQND